MQADEIKQSIETALSGAEALVEGDGTHFTVIVIYPMFAGKSRIERQQLVNNTVKQPLLDGTLHALSIKTFTPDEWHQLNGP